MKYVLTIKEAQDWTISAVGGKAFALAKMYQAGVNIPKAVCVSTNAYKDYVRRPQVQEVIGLALKKLSSDTNAVKVEEITGQLRQSLSGILMPQSVREEIEEAYRRIIHSKGETKSLAVRSSATAEDLPSASFAGQHDTFLSLTGIPQVLDAVQKSWASLWTARAVAYRQKIGIEHEKVSMAVIIQEMIDSVSAGVLFTINPLTNKTSQMMINGVWGLGESIVSGENNADEWVIDHDTGTITRKEITTKLEMIVGSDNKTKRIKVPGPKRTLPSLSLAQIEQLRKMGIRLENHFRQPQDIEWAFSKDGELYVLQSRPITTLTKQSANLRPEPFQISQGYWTRMEFSEWFQQPLSPLFSTFLLPKMNDLTDSLIEERLGIQRVSPTWKIIDGYYFINGKILIRPPLLLLPFRFVRSLYSVGDEWINQIVPKHVQKINQLSNFSPSEESTSNTIKHLEKICIINAELWGWIILSGLFSKAAVAIFEYLSRPFVRKTILSVTSLVSGFPNKSSEADEALWELSQKAKANAHVRELIEQEVSHETLNLLENSEHTQEWFTDFCAWIDTYGHRIFELDFLYETIQDNPLIALRIIRNYVKSHSDSPKLRQQQMIEQRIVAKRKFEKILDAKWFLIRKILMDSLGLAQKYAEMRESRPFYLHLGWPIMRQDILELGKRLVSSNILESINDVFFLTADELKSWAMNEGSMDSTDIRFTQELVNIRRDDRNYQKSLIPPEHINPGGIERLLLSHFLTNQSKTNKSEGAWYGIAGSPGKVRGDVCIINSQDDFGKFEKGQILVAPYTTPAWTPLLALAVGVVTERGGTLSHAAIVAREYGIPSVIGVSEVISVLSDGMEIEVDGDKGFIRIK